MNDKRTTVADETTYTDLRSANIARQAAWCPDQVPDLSFRGNELAGETGEVCNVIKKLERERLGWRGSRDTVEHLAEELADVVICADLAAISAGIDLDAAVIAKFNATSEKVGLPHRLTELQHRRAGTSLQKAQGTPDGWVLVPRELTLDMEQAHYDAHAKAETVFASAQEVWSAMLAASPSSPASGVRVKALAWTEQRDESDRTTYWFAPTPWGRFQIDRPDDHLFSTPEQKERFLLCSWLGTKRAAYLTLDEAKAAAQADYEARILSALGEHP